MTASHAALAPLSHDEILVIRRAQIDFPFFLEVVFARSFDAQRFRMSDGSRQSFSLGQVHRAWATLAQAYNRLCVVAPRMHLKSTVLNLDRPDGERVAEAVGVDVGDASVQAVTSEDDVQVVVAKRPALDTRPETY